MKVYVVHYYDSEDDGISKIFSHLEDAESYVSDISLVDRDYSYFIREIEVFDFYDKEVFL